MSSEKANFPIWDWVKAICALALTVALCAKIYTTPTTITIDFPTLLSLLLALFSVALSALFYFKATDTSNAFYDNTYKFTKDIAELLVKIESGFGERLRHLDEGYSSMRNYLQGSVHRQGTDVEETKKELETEQQEIEKVRAERNEIVQQLIERSQLQQVEKDQIAQQLLSKEEELTRSQEEIAKLNRRLTVERFLRRKAVADEEGFDSPFARYTYERVIGKIGVERVIDAPSSYIRALFDKVASELPRGYIADLERKGYFDSGLTLSGAKFMKGVAENRHAGER
ncbi:hypothetical protein [Roseateles sp.]|uniref:hypothetical protein n=1 Tax=Roseateles sp. TaxID=1971397 RepID=UPI002DFC1F25|nr:hypothetical protein [Roseateles sp.]